MMRTIKDVFYTCDNDPKRSLDLHLPEGESFPVFVYIHGGGLEALTKEAPTGMAEYFTERGVALVSVEYRMYPSAKYPDFIEDVAAAVAWVKAKKEEYGFTKIFVGGSSAGGYLSQMLCFDNSWLAKHGVDNTEIDGYILDAGQPTAHFNVLRERGIDPRRIIVDESAPLWHIGRQEKYAPMFIIYSDNDMENRPEQTQLMISTLRHFRYDMSKVEVQMVHGDHCQYVMELNENGENRLAEIVYPCIEKYSK